MSHDKGQPECCPPFYPNQWENKVHRWNNKVFIRETMPQVFHIPFPGCVRSVTTKLWKQAREAGAAPGISDFLLLAHDPSPWKSELFMLVNHEVPGADNVKLSGTYFSKVFDGHFTKVPQYIRETDIYLINQGKLAKKYYFYFTTCPKCARKYEHNYIVAIAEL
ncbi:MAG TPA: hydrolase [Bacteroidales bacterium]|nr:hydrolase [Bacteroidales bacterium]